MPYVLTYILILFAGLFIFLEAKVLFQQREFKALIVASLLLGLGLAYGIDYILSSQLLPNPNISLYIFKPTSEAVDKFFQVTD